MSGDTHRERDTQLSALHSQTSERSELSFSSHQCLNTRTAERASLSRLCRSSAATNMSCPDYDERTAFLGEWGRFQRTVFSLLCLSIIPNGFTGLSMVFMGDTPAHHCLIPAALNITEEWRNASIPLDEEDSRFSQCSRHRMDLVRSYSDRGLLPWVDVNVSAIPREDCVDGWVYDQETYISTVVSEVG